MKRATRVLVTLMIVAPALGSLGQAKADFVTVSQSGTVSHAKPSFNLFHFDTSLGTLTKVDISINWTASAPGSNVLVGGSPKYSNKYDQSIQQTIYANNSLIGSFYLTASGMNDRNVVTFSGHKEISFDSQTSLDAFSDNATSLSVLSSLPSISSKAADGTYVRTSRLDTYDVKLTYTYNPFSTAPDDDPFTAAPEPSSLVLLGMASLTFAGYRGWKRRNQFLPV